MKLNLESIKRILSKMKYKDWEFYVSTMGEGFYIQIRFYDEDIITKKIEKRHGRKWYVSSFSTKDEIVRTCFLAVMIANEHEIRESFIFKGKNIFGPHINVESLNKISGDIISRVDLK